MEHIIKFLSDLFHLDSAVLEVLFTLCGLVASVAIVVAGPIYAALLYKGKRFLDHITYSVNMLDTGGESRQLRIRTPAIVPRNDLLPSNPLFKWKLGRAIYRCTEEDPFIRLDAKAMNVMIPAIVNGLSMQFGDRILQEAVGQEVRREKLWLAVTCEKYGNIKSQKIRVIIASQDVLDEAATFAAGEEQTRVQVEETYHKDRLTTLYSMKREQFRQNGTKVDKPDVVVPVEVCF